MPDPEPASVPECDDPTVIPDRFSHRGAGPDDDLHSHGMPLPDDEPPARRHLAQVLAEGVVGVILAIPVMLVVALMLALAAR